MLQEELPLTFTNGLTQAKPTLFFHNYPLVLILLLSLMLMGALLNSLQLFPYYVCNFTILWQILIKLSIIAKEGDSNIAVIAGTVGSVGFFVLAVAAIAILLVNRQRRQTIKVLMEV